MALLFFWAINTFAEAPFALHFGVRWKARMSQSRASSEWLLGRA
jgi:hypothetical protein